MNEKNIWLLPMDKTSELYIKDNNYKLASNTMAIDWYISSAGYKPHNIYITNNEEPEDGDYVLGDFPDNPIGKIISKYGKEFTVEGLNGDKYGLSQYDSKKIILTTDTNLIADGVQEIPTDFLEWFVKNSECESVEVERVKTPDGIFYHKDNVPYSCYKIIIPQDQPKTFDPTVNNYITVNITNEEPKHLSYIDVAIKMEEIEREEHQLYADVELRESFIKGYNHAQTEIEELKRDKEELLSFIKKCYNSMNVIGSEEVIKEYKQLITKHK